MARHGSGEILDALGALTRTVRAAAAQEYAALDVGNTQAKFLRHIGRHTRISQAVLARATLTDPALTGRTIESLIERGWVRRTRSDEDRRQYVLELTAAGERARKRVEEARDRIAKRMAAVLDPRDVKDFDRIATKILGAFGGDTASER
ncbi:MAG TPA: MarR family transcriptional regulator [Polyangiaceae bacterium]|nr:MarR family transcriptional regulator [Polyangiaceae bacterium]